MKHHKHGPKSLSRLQTVHPLLKEVADGALLVCPYNFTIVHGWRPQRVQDVLFESGASKKPWPESKHNYMENDKPMSLAIDIGPWVNNGIPWKETHIFAVVAGSFMTVAEDLGIQLRWGGDWDSDGVTTDQTLLDWGHLELVI